VDDLHAASSIGADSIAAPTRRDKSFGEPAPQPEQLLTPEVAAARFRVKKRWLLDHANEIPGVKRLSRMTVRFSERRLARFLEKR
jgi:hypothetical protein